MAKRRYRGPYKMTARRRYALKKAQEASAKKRRKNAIKKIGAAAGAIGGLAVAGYLGHRYGSAKIQQSVKNNRIKVMTAHRGKVVQLNAARKAVQPGAKEATRVASAISVAHPSRTTITASDRARAESVRSKLKKQSMPPIYDSTGRNIGGPDRRSYDEDNNIRSEAMTNRSVRRTLKQSKKNTQGKKTGSLKGTPGGTKTPPKAIPHRPETWKDDDWAAALAFDTPTRQPLSGGSSGKGRGTTGTPRRDPLHTLAKMRYDDAKLLGSGAPGAGDTDAFLRNAGTSRSTPRRPKKA
ncbi:hypothetical protein CL65_gp016 [Mycobacterium phage Patience]|uniref:Uncharacterized protein n=1 Tax=Mycobacterium phage Patience TaxID=1074308 RepID=G1JWC6_9CAUD|nr:hypothetical protein CL65_gp016 [Mycobacterium phage Patience]AEL97924.1 hypothetical protein PATIENCE_15 [Mycobacterium phage Patience]